MTSDTQTNLTPAEAIDAIDSVDAVDAIDVDDVVIDFTPDAGLLGRTPVRQARLPWLAICAALACGIMGVTLVALKPAPNAARAESQMSEPAPKKFELFPLPEFKE